MSVKLVSEEIKRFLKDSDSEVLCLMGKWGVGKTFAWNQYLQAAVSEKSVGLKRYSYVSLFGQNSLEELKYAIFESTTVLEQIQSKPTIKTLGDAIGILEKWGRKATSIIGSVPMVREYAPLLARSFFLAVREQIVCIDDLERVGEGLSTKDVLGLISFLKEQRGCKIALLLNDEELEGRAAEDFKGQLEKVIDVEMRFEPTPIEAGSIGANPTTSFHEKLFQACAALGIVNIRVIRKIQRLLMRLEELLQSHDKRVFEAAIPSVVLFGWCAYQPKLGPSIEFIKSFNHLTHRFLDKDKKETEEEKNSRLLLGAINFGHFDEFDQVLLESVQRGYFDSDVIEKAATDFDKRLEYQDKDNSFHAAWEKYHGSFSDNAEEVMDAMFSSFKTGVQAISPQNADGTIELFRKLGRDKQADEMVEYYMKERNEDLDFYDPHSAFFAPKDPKLVKAFADKLASFKDIRNPKDILIQIARSSGWNPEDIATLAGLSMDDFYKLFKEASGDDMRIIVGQALKFGQYDPSDPQLQIISSNAEAALKVIGKESEINRLRVESYGVRIV